MVTQLNEKKPNVDVRAALQEEAFDAALALAVRARQATNGEDALAYAEAAARVLDVVDRTI